MHRIFHSLMTVALFGVWLIAEESSKLPLITVTGTHEIDIVPDEIKITVHIDNREKLLQLAKEKTDSQAKKLVSLAKTAQIEPEDVVTSYLLLEPVRNYRKTEGRQIIYFRALQRITLTLHDFSRYEALMDALIKDGFGDAAVQYGVSDLPGYRKKARVNAILAAQEKAKLLAESVGQKIGKAYSIKEVVQTDTYFRPNAVSISNTLSTAAASDTDDDINGGLTVGNIPVIVTVEASFLLE